MTIAKRVSAVDAKALVDAQKSLLVCIYDDDKFNAQAHLAGAIPMSRFMEMKSNLSKDADIIFY